MLFAVKRGRPKSKIMISQNQELYRQNLAKSADADVLQSLFLLKKITEEQNESAKFYQKLYNQYHSSIDSPRMSTSSMLQIESSWSRAKQHPREQDHVLFMIWNEIKVALNNVDRTCEEILHKVLIENKMKYELLNPTSFTRNNLRILQTGLDCIEKYRAKLDRRVDKKL